MAMTSLHIQEIDFRVPLVLNLVQETLEPGAAHPFGLGRYIDSSIDRPKQTPHNTHIHIRAHCVYNLPVTGRRR